MADNFETFSADFDSADEALEPQGGNEFDFVADSPASISDNSAPQEDLDGGLAIELEAGDQTPSSGAVLGDTEAKSQESSPSPSPSSSSSTPLPDPSEDPNSPLARWQAERTALLAQREQEAQQKKQAALDKAKQEVQREQQARQQRIDLTKKQNREQEQALQAEMDHTFNHGTLWQKVGKLVDLKGAGNDKDEDRERMRKLLLQLQNEN